MLRQQLSHQPPSYFLIRQVRDAQDGRQGTAGGLATCKLLQLQRALGLVPRAELAERYMLEVSKVMGVPPIIQILYWNLYWLGVTSKYWIGWTFLEQYNSLCPLRIVWKQYGLYTKHHQKTCSQTEIRMNAKCRTDLCHLWASVQETCSCDSHFNVFVLASIIGFHEQLGCFPRYGRPSESTNGFTVLPLTCTNKWSWIKIPIYIYIKIQGFNVFLNRQYVLNTVEPCF